MDSFSLEIRIINILTQLPNITIKAISEILKEPYSKVYYAANKLILKGVILRNEDDSLVLQPVFYTRDKAVRKAAKRIMENTIVEGFKGHEDDTLINVSNYFIIYQIVQIVEELNGEQEGL
jgi:predicted transcriptional regulator